MNKLFAKQAIKQAIKQALHAANIFLFALIVFSIVFTHDDLRARGIELVLFAICLKMGAIILALCPDKRISLGLIALGFVLCCYESTPPPRYMGAITLSVGALIFWAYIGDKKWWLLPIPLLIAMTLALFKLYEWNAFMFKYTLIYYGIVFLCVLCTDPIKDTYWFLRCLLAIVVLWFLLWCFI
ncbi:hypothetical protein [Helicobacter felis]|uniref:hypothetical protein n=1 Tax=Helicobacter felis TaxID=214 RepID=UPI000CF029F0|nr:hypothetical protein [Helicobacter felis]